MRPMLTVFAVVYVVLFANWARAEEKRTPKPSVCMSYSIAKTDKANDDALAICYDGKKPTLYYRFSEVEVVDAGTGRVRVLVGWR